MKTPSKMSCGVDSNYHPFLRRLYQLSYHIKSRTFSSLTILIIKLRVGLTIQLDVSRILKSILRILDFNNYWAISQDNSHLLP